MSAKFPRGGGAGPFLARSLYVMQFINLYNDKSEATSQLGYIPLSLFSQICQSNINNYNKRNTS